MTGQVGALKVAKMVLQGAKAPKAKDASTSLQAWQERLAGYIYQTVGMMRIEDLFDIAKSYPESAVAVKDLTECLRQSDLQRTLIRVFRAACASRLHIPGQLAPISAPQICFWLCTRMQIQHFSNITSFS